MKRPVLPAHTHPPAAELGKLGLGSLGNPDDVDHGYVVELALRWHDLPHGAAHVPPRPGDQWHAGFFLVDKTRSQDVRFAAWNRVGDTSFHHTERFGTIVFQ